MLVLARFYFKDSYINRIIIFLLCSGILYGGIAYLLFYRAFRPSGRLFYLSVFLAVIVRLLYFNSSPEVISDDVYRYLWDGKVQTEGINPYRYPPDSRELRELRDNRIFPLVNHKEFRSSYPPVSQFVFRIAFAAGGGSLLPLRIIYFFAEGGIVIFLYFALRNKGRTRIRRGIIAYLLCPLLVLEVYGGMHIDILGTAFFVAAWYFFYRKRYYPFLLLFTVSVLIKYVPLAAAPLFIIEYIRRRASVGLTISTVGDIALKIFTALCFGFLLYLPFLDAGILIFKQVWVYARYWEFNGGVYRIFQELFGPARARWVRFIPITAVALYTAAHPKISIRNKIVLTFLFFTVLNATVYPWYFLWIVPFFASEMKKGELSIIILIPISYYILGPYKTQGIWEERSLFLFLQYIPFFILILHDIFTGKYVRK